MAPFVRAQIRRRKSVRDGDAAGKTATQPGALDRVVAENGFVRQPVGRANRAISAYIVKPLAGVVHPVKKVEQERPRGGRLVVFARGRPAEPMRKAPVLH